MKLVKFLPVLALAACADSATKQESVQIFAAANAALTTAQTKAVESAKATNQLTEPNTYTLDYGGPCSLGGNVTVKGDYTGDGADERAVFDLKTSFTGCREATGTVDGTLSWKSTASSNGFAAEMVGMIDWSDSKSSASCDFDMRLIVTKTSVSYRGYLCGYNVGELVLGGR